MSNMAQVFFNLYAEIMKISLETLLQINEKY